VTEFGGGTGEIFIDGPGGKLKTFYKFCSQTNSNGTCLDGSYPMNGLLQVDDRNFYGVTRGGGSGNPACWSGAGCGTFFKITPSGQLTTLYNFCSQTNCTDGGNPNATLVQGDNGNFYGTNLVDGAYGAGTIFEITRSGQLTTLYAFCSQGPPCKDGKSPSGLVRAPGGDFYGVTILGGTSTETAYNGTVFRITPEGKLTTLYHFCNCGDGSNPQGALVQGPNGNFYGITTNGAGTIFEITPGGALTTLSTFCSTCGSPSIPLVLGTDGNFYGATLGNTVFQMTPSGTVTTLYTPCSFNLNFKCPAFPNGLMQATNGTFYGSMGGGGAYEEGAFYSLSMGLGPFVESTPTFGKVGHCVDILGTALTGTTSVTFNGVAATLEVVSDTDIRTTVPSGATSGTIEVTTPSGTLTSNVAFQVLP
jgi:uncharacterized repeat protein (TIGR03803 family)